MKDKFDDFLYWYDHKIGYKIRRFTGAIKNLIVWFPVIVKDHDWDQHYIYEILAFKLERTAKYFRRSNIFVGETREAEKMELCVRLIRKIQAEDYESEFYDKLDEKYGKTTNYVDPSTHFFEMKYDKNYTPEELEEIRKERWEAIVKGAKKQERAGKILFTLLERNMPGWWD